MELSQRSLAAIRELAEGTAATLANIESDFATTLTTIQTAITSAVIGPADAVALWKAARRRRFVSERNAELVNLPCSYAEPVAGGGAEAEALPGTARVGHRAEHRFESGGKLLGRVNRQPCEPPDCAVIASCYLFTCVSCLVAVLTRLRHARQLCVVRADVPRDGVQHEAAALRGATQFAQSAFVRQLSVRGAAASHMPPRAASGN